MPALDGSELLLSHESTCSALAKGWVWMSKQISYFCTFCAQKKKKVALSLKRRGSQKAKLSFAKPKLRDVCWKPSLELSVHLVGLSDLMSHLWLLPSLRVNHFSCFLTIWDNKRSSWKYYGSQPGARCGVRRGDLWITSFQELQISFWSLKKGEVGQVVYIKPHLWDLQPGGDSFGGKSIPDLLQAVMKIVV